VASLHELTVHVVGAAMAGGEDSANSAEIEPASRRVRAGLDFESFGMIVFLRGIHRTRNRK
jgi:hypothetical protein